MDDKTLDKIRRKLEEDEAYMRECYAYDDMDDMVWELPPNLAIHEWVRKRVSTDAHDILKTATNLFDTHNPKWQVLPRGPADGDRAEEIERWIEWFMRLAGENGDQDVFRLMLKHATKYNRICAQMEYEPYWLTKGTDEYKESLLNPFHIVLHYPGNVHYAMAKELQWVASVTNVCATDCVERWEDYEESDKQIKSGLNKLRALLDEDDEARIMYVDYTDEEKRWVFAYQTDSSRVDMELTVPEDYIVIFDGENTLGFINWVVSRGTSDALLFSLHHGGLWENQCFLDTIADSVVIRRGFFPLLKHTSVSGKPLEVDYSGTEGSIELSAVDGENAEVINPPPLDPGIRELMDRNSQRGASATGLKGLQNINITGNVQFASIQAMIQVSKSTLDPYIRVFEKAAIGVAKLALLWVRKNGDTLTAYRNKTTNRGLNKVAGAKINIGPQDYDPKYLNIDCELLSNQPGDELQRMNVFSQAAQLGLPIPKGEIVERMGWGAQDVLYEDWLKEKMQEIALATFQKQQDLQLQMQAQQAMQPQPQQPPPGMSPPQQGAGPQPAMEMAQGGPGMNPNMGGEPPAAAAPQMTQTATRGPG